ncbi:hypothetical protein GUITHDRAFT_68471 [Guillardia theta CCMP2712]|uniref:PPM-type phosphatase domain-containing protein n=1 Tax=Guillardia theta (strain CCMP2712) TaxID=905079 RepID=L1JK76_GUITC|nr:hypothetical protein GUITHDRAFT_68471 [Guillardia theta CCMP2712]EKX48722.1 hypothetical protein GUITHDRAFT_68471 [Guillardia theta CCMP2712]|eukprot:XP_005835702.1 hypothetical protein GUITHDRAFT_68471 [Guillardia theta CCMP2712]
MHIRNSKTSEVTKLLPKKKKKTRTRSVSKKACSDSGKGRPLPRFWIYEAQGDRPRMEDTHVAQLSFHKDKHVFGVFDGHAGDRAAKLLSTEIVGILRDQIMQRSGPQDSALGASLTSSFLEAEKRALAQPWDDGSSAILAVIDGDRLFVANAGDCRAIICGEGEPMPMSTDHDPTVPEERKRIEANNKRIESYEINGRSINRIRSLAMSRCIGDKSLKQYRHFGTDTWIPIDDCIIPDPEIKELLLTKQHKFLVIASDGLWATVTNEAVARRLDTLTEEEDPAEELQKLIDRREDNITIVVVDLRVQA